MSTTDRPLTAKQIEVLNLKSRGYEIKQIAGMLNISTNAVADRLNVAVKKLGARNVTHAVAKAVSLNLDEKHFMDIHIYRLTHLVEAIAKDKNCPDDFVKTIEAIIKAAKQ